MAADVCGYEYAGRPPCQCPRGEHGPCPACWRFMPLEERAALLARSASTELVEPTSTCVVPGCDIPDTDPSIILLGDVTVECFRPAQGHDEDDHRLCERRLASGLFVCIGHWRRLPLTLRHELVERRGAPGLVERALVAVASSEGRFADRHPPRPVTTRG